jgi:hypothetical protein
MRSLTSVYEAPISHLPEIKIFSVNTVEVSLATRILLDRLLQSADRFRLCDLDRKDASWVIAKDPTVEIEHIRHVV